SPSSSPATKPPGSPGASTPLTADAARQGPFPPPDPRGSRPNRLPIVNPKAAVEDGIEPLFSAQRTNGCGRPCRSLPRATNALREARDAPPPLPATDIQRLEDSP